MYWLKSQIPMNKTLYKKQLIQWMIGSIIFMIYQLSFASIRIDGSLNDWQSDKMVVILDKAEQRAESPGNWLGPDDLSGTIYMAEDAENIYLAAEIKDNKPLWNPRGAAIQPAWWKTTYNGDALRVIVTSSGKTTNIFLFPGCFGIDPFIYVYQSTGTKPFQPTEVEIVSGYSEKYAGYVIESRIPKTHFALPLETATFQFELFDSDGPANSYKSLKGKPVSIPVKK